MGWWIKSLYIDTAPGCGWVADCAMTRLLWSCGQELERRRVQSIRIDGSVLAADRHAAVERFQKDPAVKARAASLQHAAPRRAPAG
jgi:hypothetical protein